MTRKDEMNRMRVCAAAPVRSSRAGLVLLLAAAAAVLSGCHHPPHHGYGYNGGQGQYDGHGRTTHGQGGPGPGHAIDRRYPGYPGH